MWSIRYAGGKRLCLQRPSTRSLQPDICERKPVSKRLLRKRERNETERNRILEAVCERAKEKDPKLKRPACKLRSAPQKRKLKGQIYNWI